MADLLGFHPPLVRRGIFKGVNLAALVERFWRLEAMRVHGSCSAPEVRWRAYSRASCAWGIAHVAFRHITFRVGPGASVEEAVECLLHEVVHCACPLRESHGELFCRRLIASAREAFGLELDTATLLSLPALRGCRAYAIDAAIVAAMVAAGVGERLRADPACRFEPPPVETELEIEARLAMARAARVKAREEHARAKLAEWERKAQAARRIAAKWRTKVRYYDRQQEAAKGRGS